MLEKPNIPEELIIARLQEEYQLRVLALNFLPLGADMGTAVYRVIADHGTAYFLKLRRGFDQITVVVPLFLKSQGIQEIITPVQTKSKQYWTDFDEYTMIVYPFIDGQDGFEIELTDAHRKILGKGLKRIHSAQLPPELMRVIPSETFDSKWRESLKFFQAQVEKNTYQEPTAAKLADFMKTRRKEINDLLARTEELASELQAGPLELVLCHTDLHGGNILIPTDRQQPGLFIVDWDTPLLAPKERDLMFIGGGIDAIWKSDRDEAVFYRGYGEKEIDLPALAYYRYERIIEDLAAICEQLLFTGEGGADRERSYGWFTSNFEPGGTLEIAERTEQLLKPDR